MRGYLEVDADEYVDQDLTANYLALLLCIVKNMGAGAALAKMGLRSILASRPCVDTSYEECEFADELGNKCACCEWNSQVVAIE